jgi:hypothetical protein
MVETILAYHRRPEQPACVVGHTRASKNKAGRPGGGEGRVGGANDGTRGAQKACWLRRFPLHALAQLASLVDQMINPGEIAFEVVCPRDCHDLAFTRAA